MNKIVFILLSFFLSHTLTAGINTAPLSLTLTTTNTTCNSNNGSIVANVSGGTAPYTYSINGNPAQNNKFFLYLLAGSYTITVTDALGASTSASTTLTNMYQHPFVSSLLVNPTGCSTADGSLSLEGNGGTPPYLYSIDETNFQTSNVFPNLTAGWYYVRVKDANGCVSDDDILHKIALSAPYPSCPITYPGLGASYTCQPFKSEMQLIGLTGGTPPYSYSLDGINYQSSNDFEGLSAGLHKQWVKDAAGLIYTFTVAIVNRCPPDFSISATAVSATCGSANGSITATPTYGIGPYIYSLDGTNFQSGAAFTGLAPGPYTVTSKDAEDLIRTATVTVGNNCLSVTAIPSSSTCGLDNGRIVATGSSGDPAYQYSLDGINFQTSNTFDGIKAGVYTVTIKDGHSSTSMTTVTVGDVSGPAITSTTSTAASCNTPDGTVTITASGGTAPLEYSLNGLRSQADAIFTAVASGDLTASVTDANGCTTSANVTVPLNNILVADAGQARVICEGTGVLLNASSNGTGFSWSPSTGLDKTDILQPHAAPATTTTYTLTVTEGACSASDAVIVVVNPAPVADAGSNTAICFGKDAQLNGSGGTSYSWSPATFLNNAAISDPTVIKPTSSITYSLTVKDDNQCSSLGSATVVITVTPPAEVFAGHDTAVVIGQPLSLNAIDVNNSGFSQFSWSPAYGLNDPLIQQPVAVLDKSVVYIVMASTPDGCSGLDTISIKVYARADIYVPNAFTPNGDGHNDIVRAIPVGIKAFSYFVIFDRWGRQVFHTTNPGTGWDGVVNGTALQAGNFVWMAAGEDYEGHTIQRKGTLLLVR